MTPARKHLGILLLAAAGLLATGAGAATTPGHAGGGDMVDGNVAAKETVVVLHGLGRNKASVWLLASRIEAAGFAVERIGYKSLKDNPQRILDKVRGQINACCAQRETTVHFVGHSLGGLLVRAYLADKPVKHLGRVVLIGSPSQGTPVVDDYRDAWWMKFAGPTANALGTGSNSFPKTLPPPDYPLGVIAGKVERLVDYPEIPGDDDGLVPVEATRVDGMKDFVVIESNHAMLRYNELAAEQAIAFLKSGQFTR